MPRKRKAAEPTIQTSETEDHPRRLRHRRRKPKITGELKETLDAVTKRFGSGVIQSGEDVMQPDRISTGVFILDLATLGGIPHNRCSMVVGERHAGKTTIASKILGNVQRQFPNQHPVYLDIEGTLDTKWAEDLGVDISHMQVARCETGEMAVDVADALIESKEVSLIVVDSVAALTPYKEIDSSAEDAHVGLQARLMSSFIRKVTSGMIRERRNDHFVTILFLNQFRSKIGGFQSFGEPRSIPGGKALEFATSLQLILKNKENKGRNSHGVENIATNEHPYTITKNKMCNGPRTGEFTLVREDDAVPGLLTGEIDNAPTILTYAKKFGYYTGAGKNQKLEFDDISLTFGKQDLCIQMLREDHDIQHKLWWQLVAHQAKLLRQEDEFVTRLFNMRNHFVQG